METLDCLEITGPIAENTPYCVLIEIADAHGLRYDSSSSPFSLIPGLVDSINNTSPPYFTHQDKNTLPALARFVNRNERWPQDKLISAYNFIRQFTDDSIDPLTLLPLQFDIGRPTPRQPQRINACILYCICHYHKINITSKTTMEQMAQAVRLLRDDVASVMRRVRVFIEAKATRTDLINILMMSPYTIDDPDPPQTVGGDYRRIPADIVNHDILNNLHHQLTDVPTLQRKITPSTNEGAVALAAINYSIDLTGAQYPLKEYQVLCRIGRTDYKPDDPWLRYWSETNSRVIDLMETFNPIFPENYYRSERLSTLAEREGYTLEEIAHSSPYELLQLAYVSDTFYYGLLPGVTEDVTPISLEPIEDVLPSELLIYGNRSTQQLHTITIEELYEHMSINKSLVSPFNPESTISTIALNKLRLYLRQLSVRSDAELYSNLVNKINMIEHLHLATDEPTRQLLSNYHDSDENMRHEILDTLYTLLYAGMAMRGWFDDTKPFPVEEAPVDRKDNDKVAIAVTQYLNQFEDACQQLGAVGDQIKSLPLVRNRSGHYHKSTDVNDGLTIGDRITITREGYNTQNIKSCIRMSSNWLCASAHKYLMILNQPAPFNLLRLRSIS